MPLCYAPMVTPPVDLELLGHPGVELGILAAWTVELNFTGIQLNQFCRKSWGWSKFATHEKYQCTSTSWKVKLWKEVVPERWRYKDIERHRKTYNNTLRHTLRHTGAFKVESICRCQHHCVLPHLHHPGLGISHWNPQHQQPICTMNHNESTCWFSIITTNRDRWNQCWTGAWHSCTSLDAHS